MLSNMDYLSRRRFVICSRAEEQIYYNIKNGATGARCFPLGECHFGVETRFHLLSGGFSLSRICAHEIYQQQQQQRVPSVFMRLNDLSTFCFLIKSLPFFPGRPELLIRSRINQLTGPLILDPSEFIQI
jgi:hypothetical protein